MGKKIITVQNEAEEQQSTSHVISTSSFVDNRSEFLSKIDFVALNRILNWVPVEKNGRKLSDAELLKDVVAFVNKNEFLKQDLFKGSYLRPVFVPFEDQNLYEKLGQSKMQFKDNNISVVERNEGTKEHPDWKIGVMTSVRVTLDKESGAAKIYPVVCVNYKTPEMLLSSGANVYMSKLSKEELGRLWNTGHCVHTYDIGKKKGTLYVCYINSVTGQVEGKDMEFIKSRLDKMIESNRFYGVEPNREQYKKLLQGYAVSFEDKNGETFFLQFHPEKYTFLKNERVESKAQQTGLTCEVGKGVVQSQEKSQSQEEQVEEAVEHTL